MFLPKWVVVGGLALALAEAFSENSVYLKSPDGYLNKLVTSSTLRWITAEKGAHPETAVVGTIERYINESIKVNPFKPDEEGEGIVERDVYICRASHSGLWIPGQLRVGRGACLISLHDNIYSYDRYEVLENNEGGARLTWTRWDKFNDVPSGAVSSGEAFVAKRPLKQESDKSLGLKDVIGKLDESGGYGKLNVITEDEKEEEVGDGLVLIEIEPIRYELTNIKFNEAKRIINKSPITLGEAILANSQNISGNIDTMIGYDDNSSMYWGQVKAMLKGLPTIIRGLSGTDFPDEIEWGIPQREFTKRLKAVEAMMEPETAVNVTLKGNHTEIETPYTAKLIAVYADGANRARQIHGVRGEVKLLDITPEFSPVYFTGNYSLVPTTTTTTTSTTTTTTTSTTAKSTTSSQTTTESTTNNMIPKKVNTNTIDKDEELSNKVNIMNDQGSHSHSPQASGGLITKINSVLFIVTNLVLLCRIL